MKCVILLSWFVLSCLSTGSARMVPSLSEKGFLFREGNNDARAAQESDNILGTPTAAAASHANKPVIKEKPKNIPPPVVHVNNNNRKPLATKPVEGASAGRQVGRLNADRLKAINAVYESKGGFSLPKTVHCSSQSLREKVGGPAKKHPKVEPFKLQEAFDGVATTPGKDHTISGLGEMQGKGWVKKLAKEGTISRLFTSEGKPKKLLKKSSSSLSSSSLYSQTLRHPVVAMPPPVYFPAGAIPPPPPFLSEPSAATA